MVFQKLWVSQNFSGILRVSQCHFFNSYVHLTVLFFIRRCHLPFVTTYHPAASNLKQTLMEQWSLIQNQPLLQMIYLKPPIVSYKRGESLKVLPSKGYAC